MYPEIDYFIDETNNGWVNGVPARVANRQMNDMVRDNMAYTPSYGEYIAQLLNYIRQPRNERVNYFPNALGY